MSLITIDGPAGSGKTTLAGILEDALRRDGADVFTIHMDDLYDGWENALDGSLTENLKKLVQEFSESDCLNLPQYNWIKGRFGEPLVVPTPAVLILEGVGSGQRVTRPMAEIKLWVEVPSSLALQRVLDRDGEGLRDEMQRWQILEAEHFALEGTKSAADYRVKSAP